MGKRRERRLAAMMAASRRVKLDLFTEPSGEMVGNSLHDEVGGDLDKDHHEVPSSPSSSGQKQENPLLLLEQYSDDELEDDTSEQPTHTAEASVSTGPEVQGQESVGASGIAGSKPDNADATGDIKDDDQLDHINNVDSNDTKESDVALAASQYTEADPASQTVLDASGMQIVGDLTGNWKVVMHGQSNQYYYWNTVTGETSWEIPSGMEVSISGVDLSSTVGGQVAYPVLMHANNAAPEMHGITNLVPTSMEAYGTVELDKENGKRSGNAFLDFSKTSGEDLSIYEVKHATETTACYETTDIHSAELVKYGQSLLQRLKAVKGSLNGHEWMEKEIEFRISDCRALSSYGLSLLPFWWHTETQLKQLESVISREEASFVAEKSILLCVGAASEVVEKINGENHQSVLDTAATVVQTDEHMPEIEGTIIKGFSSGLTSKNLGTDTEVEGVQPVSNVESHTEDVDMDVEMEVDDETITVHTAAQYSSTTECPASVEPAILTNTSSVVSTSVPADEPSIPPPPDEEWIPPPPPDSELIPPPPPEDPPLPSYPPPYAEAIPPPFQDQYSLGYAVPSYEYYAPAVSEVTSVSYYVHADGSHISETVQPSYYEPVVSSSYPELVADVQSVEPITYYGISGGAVPHVPVVTVTGSSGYYVESGPVSYNDGVSILDQASSVGYTMESVNSVLPPVKHESDVAAVSKEPDKGSVQVTSNASSMQFASNASLNGSTTVATSAATKSKSRVLRGKKRTVAVAPTLRSNKKVSSLVDKWKAAKEELHGEEDEEPEDALEILEKKRQKEIEEWRARQIASGEAQDNANFLPLGGDWRERVKRRRAEAKTGPGETVPGAAVNEKKQPDLAELSRSLPPGWQAYWDESSKEVYYGNSSTSETTWTKPAR
ncbi:uncharacterized protein LOC103974258 isoform X1 [Musa acuminata AAA Group]|uniref:uncharacterized protein LOC103974258 isoform X1 n=2 Tax=Musa acuminata AAA Group TaxID=214697 RepID=UPI0031E3C3AC